MATGTDGRVGSRWGLVAQVVAVAGILLCLAVIVGIWFGRGFLQGGLDDIGASVDRGFERGIAAATAVIMSDESAGPPPVGRANGDSGVNPDRRQVAWPPDSEVRAAPTGAAATTASA